MLSQTLIITNMVLSERKLCRSEFPLALIKYTTHNYVMWQFCTSQFISSWVICHRMITVQYFFFSCRLAQSFPKPIDSKPLLSQRETPPSGTLQQRGDRRPLSEPFDWSEAPHYDNTGFDAEESPLDPPSSTGSQGNPPLGSKPRSQSTHGRRPLLRQERIVGVPLELDTQTLPFHSNQRPTPDNDPQSGSASQNPWQNWTRTPSPLEDRTAFPSKLDITPTSSPNPDRKDIDSR